ncbi:hypothetical protein PRIPAC_79565 [Pristionchus pacificus]|uniref:Uncharacterized protein n=1 Tax=Pristionchus pacificus TaxID=54126 RepID=A0A2A6BXX2_PRIPA|nr:hypothetical protein PRIPAC_79565 [Pristionchus pacificus]|eukprot:PDM70784.1 hypothetical protein PRIPAC_44988 [Pristionchus pacificus]
MSDSYSADILESKSQNERSGFYSVAVSIYFLLVFTALIVNSTMLIVLFRLRKRLFEPPGTFYTVVIELMAFTSLNSLVQTVFVAPQYAHQSTELASNAVVQRVYFVLDMISNYGILAFSTLVAGNRYSTFYLGCTCPIFRRPRIYYLIFLILLAVISLSALPSLLGCSMLHAATAAGFVDFCPDKGLAERITIGLGATYYVVCAISAQFYVRTYLLIKNQRGHLIEKENHRRSPEMVILKQALVIFGLYIISLVLTTILPLFCSSTSSILLSMSLNTVSLLLSIAYPGLFLVSSGEMRRDVISWIPLSRTSCWKRSNHRVSSAESITSRSLSKSISGRTERKH